MLQWSLGAPTTHPTLLARLRLWQPGYLLSFCPPRLAVRTWYPVFGHERRGGQRWESTRRYNQKQNDGCDVVALACVDAAAFSERK